MPDIATALRHVEHVMGTVFSFDIRDRPTPAIRHALAEAVHHLHRVDAVFSTYRPDSHISRLNRGGIRLKDCPSEVHEVLANSGIQPPWDMRHATGPPLRTQDGRAPPRRRGCAAHHLMSPTCPCPS